MTQPSSQQQPPSKPKQGSYLKWVVLVVVVVVIIAGVVVGLTYHPATKKTPALSVSPTTTGVSAQAGTNITFFPGLPTNAVFTKIVWNFGNGYSETVTQGTGQVSYAYPDPGSYLVSVTAYNSTSSVSSNSSLISITILPALNSNPGAVFGPIDILGSSQNGNQTISTGGWVNMTYTGTTFSKPVTVGSGVPGDLSYTITSFKWSINNGSKTIADNNTGLPETVNLTFSNPGIYAVSLITTSSTSSGATATGTYIVTIAVGNYHVSSTVPSVPINQNIVVNAELQPGGFDTIDPSIEYEVPGYEIIYEIYEPLVYYNGESTTSFIPVIATNVPSVANGEITSWNYMGTGHTAENYTFYINTSLSFSNGDHVTPYDVYVSILRTLLFANDPSDPGWLVAHALLPGSSVYGPFNNSFYWIHRAVTWNNQTSSVTFHLLPSTSTWLPNATATYANESYGMLNQSYPVQSYGGSINFFQLLAGPTCAWVQDYNWLKLNGAIPSNTSASYAYFSNASTSPGFIANWNQKLKYNGVGTGPYEISLMEAGSEVVLKVNPYYNATPGMPSKSSLIPQVEIEYLSNIATAQEQIQSGYAQFATNAYPPNSASSAVGLISSHVLSSAEVTEIATQGLGLNLDVNVTGTKTYDSQANIPAQFFDNKYVRMAFSYAFNESYNINVANTADGVVYAHYLTGMLPSGTLNYPANLTYPYSYSMSLARYYWNLTPYAKNGTTLYFPIMNFEGTPNWDEMITVWISALSQMSGGMIKATLVDLPGNTMTGYFGEPVGDNPMPVFVAPWYDDYPDPTDFAAPYYQEGGFFATPLSLAPTSVFNPTNYPEQWANITKMWNLFDAAAGETNSTLRTLYFYEADQIAVNMAFYIGEYQVVNPLFYSSSILKSSLADTLNPYIGGSFIIYYSLQYVKS